MDYDELRTRFRDVAFTTATPFTEDGEDVDHDALAANIEFMADAGARLFIPCGNTGEYYALTDEERIAIVQTHAEAAPDDAVLVAGVGGSVKEATALAEAYEEAGADATMVMHPTFTYATERGLVNYYERIGDATDLGLVIYKRGPDVTRRVVHEVTQREDAVAVKFAVNDVKEFSQTVADGPEDVAWVNGIAERYAVGFAAEGAVGYTTGIGNFAPEAVLALFDALDGGDWERAREIREIVRPYEDLRAESGPDNVLGSALNVPSVKYGLELAGANGGPVRDPLGELTDEDRARAEEYYEAIENADL